MLVVEYQQIELDCCPACEGVWFDAEELEMLLASLGITADDLIAPLDQSDEQPRRCRYCGAKMTKARIGPGEGVVIDQCPEGHGLWFDGGELETVVRGLQDQESKPGVGSFIADVLFAGDAVDGASDEPAESTEPKQGDDT
jgi:hypothetical protein